MFGDVQLAERHQPWDHVLVGELQNPDGVPLLDGGVVRVEVLQESQEVLQGRVGNLDLRGDNMVV